MRIGGQSGKCPIGDVVRSSSGSLIMVELPFPLPHRSFGGSLGAPSLIRNCGQQPSRCVSDVAQVEHDTGFKAASPLSFKYNCLMAFLGDN